MITVKNISAQIGILSFIDQFLYDIISSGIKYESAQRNINKSIKKQGNGAEHDSGLYQKFDKLFRLLSAYEPSGGKQSIALYWLG